MRHRQTDRARERGHPEEPQRGDPVRIVVGRDTARGDRRDRTGPESADDRARDDGRDERGQGGTAVAEEGEREPEAGECAGSGPVDP